MDRASLPPDESLGWMLLVAYLISISLFFLADKILVLFLVATCPTTYSCHRILKLGMIKSHGSG